MNAPAMPKVIPPSPVGGYPLDGERLGVSERVADGAPRPLVAFAVAGLPTTNRGVVRSDSDPATPRTAVCVDWFAASVDLVAVLGDQGQLKTWDILQDVNGYGFQSGEVASAIYCKFFAGCDVNLDREQRKGSFHKWRYHLTSITGEKVGQIEFGGPHTMRKDGTPTARIELSGKGCRLFEGTADADHAKRWFALKAKLSSVAGRLSRCDLAYDDLDGIHNLAFATTLWLKGRLNSVNGMVPDHESISHAKAEKGDTVYIGSRASEKFMRVYEKGKQLGDPISPWVRWEIQFKSSSRKELDLEMLTNPADFMRGAYEVLDFISMTAQRLDVTKEQMKATLITAFKHLRRQYGATLNFLLHATPDTAAAGAFLVNLSGPRLPDWAHEYLGPHGYRPLLDAMRVDRQPVAQPMEFF